MSLEPSAVHRMWKYATPGIPLVTLVSSLGSPPATGTDSMVFPVQAPLCHVLREKVTPELSGSQAGETSKFAVSKPAYWSPNGMAPWAPSSVRSDSSPEEESITQRSPSTRRTNDSSASAIMLLSGDQTTSSMRKPASSGVRSEHARSAEVDTS